MYMWQRLSSFHGNSFFIKRTCIGYKTVNVAVDYGKTDDEDGGPQNLIRLDQS